MGNELNTRHLILFIPAFLLVFAAALPLNVMDIDAAQYACISRELLNSDNWTQVFDRGHDYLDKPPLLFWLSASSFEIFGVSNWAYKLPSFLFALLGIFSTAKLGELLYDKRTGWLAALMLTSSLGLFIMTNDIRTDTILLGSVTFAIWQVLLHLKTKRWINLVLGFAGIGAAMLAKGPLGLVIPALALSAEFAYKRHWKNFVRPQWLAGLIITGLILLPMCIGLYRQFDLHPEKIVNGVTGVSGLRFYFWTQSFGRITGESDWGTKFDNGAGPFFFTHTFLWVFFPWSILFAGGLLKNILKLARSRFKPGYLPELLTTGGFLLVFVALSASRYKLPHYVYVLLPLAAIIAARFFIHDVFHAAKKYLRLIFSALHTIYVVALLMLIPVLLFYVFPKAGLAVIIAAIACMLTGLVFFLKLRSVVERLLYPLLCGLLGFYFTVNLHFYPNLLRYASPAVAGNIVAGKKVAAGNYYTYRDLFAYSNDFYSGRSVYYIFPQQLDDTLRVKKSIWIYTDEGGYAELKANGYTVSEAISLDDYPIQFLTTNFLNPEKRAAILRKRFLLEIRR
jgi:4-amino-4-deoxy-L-arabinose transferase-like glycosyltransferase